MGNVFCSIGKDRLVADHKGGEKHSIGFIDRDFQSPQGLYQILEEEFQDRLDSIDSIYFTATHLPAYIIKTDDVPDFKARHKAKMLYRTLSPEESTSIIYSRPEPITDLLLSFHKPLYFIPVNEILLRAIRDHNSSWNSEYRLYAFIIDDHLSLYIDREDGPLSFAVYKCDNPEDALYYTLLLLDQKGIAIRNVTSVLGGRGVLMDGTDRLWNKYFHMESDFFDKSSDRKYFDLRAFPKCV